MAAGRPITRKLGVVHPNRPAGGVNGAAVTVTGTTYPNGGLVDVAWGTSSIDPPTTGWAAATSDVYGGFSLVTTYPGAAGTYYLWARRNHYQRVLEQVGPVVVT